jgi:hypothetical protein
VTNIRIEGGRGLLSIVDFDTVVMNAVSVFVIALLWRRRRAIGDRLPLVLFGVTLSFVTALLVGHVVVAPPLVDRCSALDPRHRPGAAQGKPPRAADKERAGDRGMTRVVPR